MKNRRTFSINRFVKTGINCSFILIMILLIASTIFSSYFTNRTAQENLQQSNEQVAMRICDTFDKMSSIAQYLAFSDSVAEFLQCEDDYRLIAQRKQLNQVIQPFLATDDQLYNIVIYRASHRIPYFASSDTTDSMFYDVAPEMESKDQSSEGFTIFSRKWQDTHYPACCTRIINTSRGNGYGDFMGTLVVILDPQFLNSALSSVSSKNISSVLILDQNDNIIARNSDSEIVSSENLRNRSDVYIRQIKNTPWSLVCIANQNYVDHKFIPFFLISFAFSAGITIFLIIIYRCLRHDFVAPISSLCHGISLLSVSDDAQRISASPIEEIDQISRSINELLDQRQLETAKIIELGKKKYEIELDKKLSDLRALENQVNPHFLLNTLACIGGMSILYNAPEITEIVSNMSDICHYSLRGPDVVTVRDEVENIQKYFNIMNIRFQHIYDFDVSVPEELLDCKLLKMALQPLVENAIHHGLEAQGHGSVRVTIRRQADELHIIVSDTGCGISPARLSQIQTMLKNSASLEHMSLFEKRVGNVNLCRRIKLMYGEAFGLKIDSEPQKGTCAEITIPYIT